jgi:ethylbenzene dehydrogenase
MKQRASGFILPLAVASILAACGGGAPPSSPAEVLAVHRAAVPDDPGDAAWTTAPVHPAALILQDLVEPRLMTPSTTQVRVQAITDGTRIAFRLEWADATKDDLPGAARFSDACAVQLPSKIEADVPAPQMGESNRPVEISYWRASWQAEVDGRKDDIRSLYPGAAVDHYPFEAAPLKPGSEAQSEMAARYAPARALGNAMEGPRDRPVQDLIAEGPGTIRPAETSARAASAGRSAGRGGRSGTGWAVVIARPLPQGLGPGGRSQVAFAVWEGSRQEVGSRKMRTPWTPLSVEAGR